LLRDRINGTLIQQAFSDNGKQWSVPYFPLPDSEARYIPSPPNDADSHGELVHTRYVSRGIEVEEITLVGKLP